MHQMPQDQYHDQLHFKSLNAHFNVHYPDITIAIDIQFIKIKSAAGHGIGPEASDALRVKSVYIYLLWLIKLMRKQLGIESQDTPWTRVLIM